MTVIPSDAATVMILRPCPDANVKDIEVLMVLRNRKSSFVPGYYVFPGGVVDPDDFGPEIENFILGMDRQEAAQRLEDMSPPDKALGAWVAAIRETFEEVGILFAQRKDGAPLTPGTGEENRQFDHYRKAIIEGKINFLQMLRKENLLLSLDRIHYFSHWITPELLPLRYDVRFFVTQAPVNQAVMHDGVELTGHRWIRPSVALDLYEQGKLGMVLPQIMTLQDISRFKTVAEVMDSAKKRHILSTLTLMKLVGDKDVEVMPDGTVYENRPPVYSWPDPTDR